MIYNCPKCDFKSEIPVIDKFVSGPKYPFVVREVWFRHFGSHLGFDDEKANVLEYALTLLEEEEGEIYFADKIRKQGLVNEVI